ncbi:MAG: acetyl-CoA carboxylase biotin carboxyl carrier protein subunit [Desulfobacterales bacterium]|nr:acetyl-CoA carboxylase biotin carboxyl carrier protein subunit [Desulfobacterales bacterium]
MEYRLRVAQTDFPVEVKINEEQKLDIMLGDNNYNVDYAVVSDFCIHMKVGDGIRAGNVNAFVADGPDGKNIIINGRSYIVQNNECIARAVKKGRPNLPDKITPPTPAVVVAIPVNMGDRVKKGQAVIVVSAMKMETTLCAPFDGTVIKINAAVNDKVAPGQILVDIEKDEQISV